MKTLIHLTLCIAAAAWVSGASAQEAGADSQTHAQAEEIFDEIMQSLPGEMKARVDSASRIRESTPRTPLAEPARPSSDQDALTARNHAINELPADVKARVEKTIAEIQQRTQQRQIEFKEMRKKHNKKQ
jgi:hypothetical protein